MKKVYLAGFDVFYPDAIARGIEMKRLCEKYGFLGLFPLDQEADHAPEIFACNTALIRQADLVMARLDAFRGLEPDSGTAFEIGYAYALAKPIYGYLEDTRSMREKLGAADADGFIVEDFGLPVNLMLSCAARIVHGGLEDCLRAAYAG